jgi:DNA-binding MarR family transcriptional regulator/GNAT superfamily N-acetyltransferase
MDMVAGIRSFNRTVTRRIGALDARFLGRDRSLGASRLLFEIGAEGIEIRELRARLGLDSGYMSRLLRGLEAEGLIRTGHAPDDARVRYVVLSAAGRKEVAALNQLSDDAAASILEPLNEKQRVALTSAMAAVEQLLLASAVRLEVEDPASRVAQQCLARYFEELNARFDAGFDPALSLFPSAAEFTPPHGFFVVASLNGEGIGCGALKCRAGYADIKRMWVAAACRGLGLGRRILHRLEDLAREHGIQVLRLETNKALTEAQSLYKSSGYREVSAFNDELYAHHWFEKTL